MNICTFDDNLFTATQEQKLNQTEKEKYLSEFWLKNMSANGTFLAQKQQIIQCPLTGTKISAGFIKVGPNEETPLYHGDIIGLIVKNQKDLVFGFQFLEC
jgi:hypothetical protein